MWLTAGRVGQPIVQPWAMLHLLLSVPETLNSCPLALVLKVILSLGLGKLGSAGVLIL